LQAIIYEIFVVVVVRYVIWRSLRWRRWPGGHFRERKVSFSTVDRSRRPAVGNLPQKSFRHVGRDHL
jgi:hypothetical protein